MRPARRLDDFGGDALYVDAMLLVGAIEPGSEWHDSARRLLARATDPSAPIRLVTSALTVDEAVYTALGQLVTGPPYGVSRNRGEYLGRHPAVVRDLMGAIEPPLAQLIEQLELEPVLPGDIAAMRRELLTSGLLPRDAIHVSVMRRLELSAIASDDVGFDRCAGIERYAP